MCKLGYRIELDDAAAPRPFQCRVSGFLMITMPDKKSWTSLRRLLNTSIMSTMPPVQGVIRLKRAELIVICKQGRRAFSQLHTPSLRHRIPMVPAPEPPISTVSHRTKMITGHTIAMNPPRRPNLKVLARISMMRTKPIIAISIANATGRRYRIPS